MQQSTTKGTESMDEQKQLEQQIQTAQKEAEMKRMEIARIQNEAKQINDRIKIINSELAKAKPALDEAKQLISNIKTIHRKQLNEIMALRNPPKLVAMTFNAVATLMGKKTKNWKSVVKWAKSNNLIASILQFDTNKITAKTRGKIEKEYLSDDDFTFERVNKASKFCGPLVPWVKSQVMLARLLNEIEPMRKELMGLNETFAGKNKQTEKVQNSVYKLENEIEEYKIEYQRIGGTFDSKQRLGERVIAARMKLEQVQKMQHERFEYFKSKSPETMKAMIQSISESFNNYSPFLEGTLLVSWQYDSEQCKEIIVNSCKKVLSAPIITEEYEWFKQYVFCSSVWMFKTKQNRFMYEELMDIANIMSHDIIDSMNSIYNHLELHLKWNQIINIENENIVSRQDDNDVGLLQENGIRDILDVKEQNEVAADMEMFVDSNLAINILTSTAKKINKEFQNHIKLVLSHYGEFRAGPMKKVERCLSKLENDYQDAKYPKAAKLLDLVRCSCTFNTVDQLIIGYEAFMKHIETNPNSIQLGRVKNGFIDKSYDGGYRDIKINVIYNSAINIGVKMVCEVQLLLSQYLLEKKRIHKLYSILREELYFKITVTKQQ